MHFLNRILDHAFATPDRVAVRIHAEDERRARTCTYAELVRAAVHLAAEIKQGQAQGAAAPVSLGLVMANSIEWVVADLALLLSGGTEVPVPFGFTAAQAGYLLKDAQVCLVDAAGDQRLSAWEAEWGAAGPKTRIRVDVDALQKEPFSSLPPLPDDYICKIIHTSGTTSTPKGVKIRLHAIDQLVGALKARLGDGISERYVSIVPLSLLIEQVAGLYMTLTAGGTITFLSPEVKLLGNDGIRAGTLIPFLQAVQPTALAVPPALVEALYAYLAAHEVPAGAGCAQVFGTPKAPFISCGGAPVSVHTLEKLAALGIPVYEGYGLSENTSVVALNSPGTCKPGTVGTPLDHAQVRLAADGELLIRSSAAFAGYIGGDPSSCSFTADGCLKTGDLAEIDGEGFIRITGRKKNIITLANGRNVSPEWIESQYNALPSVVAAVVFGDHQHELSALVFVDDARDEPEVESEIFHLNQHRFSEVERVRRIKVVRHTPETASTFFTVTGRAIRDKMWHCFAGELAAGPC